MAEVFTVLWDMNRTALNDSLRGGPEGAAAEGPPALRVDDTELTKAEVHDLSRAQEVRAIAPLMPTKLVRPVSAGSLADGPDADAAQDGVAWGIQAVGAAASPRDGAGVVPAVLDTGIDASHPAFTGVELVEEDFTGSGNGDRQGHGTHCAGTIFGRDCDGTRIGVARGISKALIGKVLDDDGSGDSSMLFHAMQWAARSGARIVSMSLGFDFPGLVKSLTEETGLPVDLATSRALEGYRANLRMFDVLMRMFAAQIEFTGGLVVAAASGNESRRDVNPAYEIGASLPAVAAGVISVGALARSATGLVVAPFSNTFPVVAAPGVGVVSAAVGGGLVGLSGTSMATPHVAGVTALWWQEAEESEIPVNSTTVSALLLANATVVGLAADVDMPDRGVGLVRAPQ